LLINFFKLLLFKNIRIKMGIHIIGDDTILELKAGDEKAFDRIFHYYYGRLCAFASQYVLDTEYEEIVQDVMMWLWENHESIANEKTLQSLLFTITKNKCLNLVSHRLIKQRVHEKLHDQLKVQFEDPDFYLPGDLMEKLEQAIKNLPQDYREAFELNRFDELTYKEIAHKFDVSEKTIAYRISQALKILRKELKDYLPILIGIL